MHGNTFLIDDRHQVMSNKVFLVSGDTGKKSEVILELSKRAYDTRC